MIKMPNLTEKRFRSSILTSRDNFRDPRVAYFVKLHFTEMESFTPKERAVNFSTAEKIRFESLIEKYKDDLFNKKSDNMSNLKKNKTWAAIHAEFNAGGDQNRSLRQLKAKFDNMKRNGRKDASRAKQSIFKTGGGPPPTPVNKDTEWFRTVMPISMEGLPSVVDDDMIESQPSTSTQNMIKEISKNPIIESIEENKNIHATVCTGIVLDTLPKVDDSDTQSPISLLRTPVSKPLRVRKISQNSHYQQKKIEVMEKIQSNEEHIHNLKIKYMAEKRKEEKDLYDLQKKKLMLEIAILENKKV